jgi:hypothetical protein
MRRNAAPLGLGGQHQRNVLQHRRHGAGGGRIEPLRGAACALQVPADGVPPDADLQPRIDYSITSLLFFAGVGRESEAPVLALSASCPNRT